MLVSSVIVQLLKLDTTTKHNEPEHGIIGIDTGEVDALAWVSFPDKARTDDVTLQWGTAWSRIENRVDWEDNGLMMNVECAI